MIGDQRAYFGAWPRTAQLHAGLCPGRRSRCVYREGPRNWAECPWFRRPKFRHGTFRLDNRQRRYLRRTLEGLGILIRLLACWMRVPVGSPVQARWTKVGQTYMTAVFTVADASTIIDFEGTLDRYRRYGTTLANRFQDGVFSKVVRTAKGPCLIALYRSGNNVELRLKSRDTAGESHPSVIDKYRMQRKRSWACPSHYRRSTNSRQGTRCYPLQSAPTTAFVPTCRSTLSRCWSLPYRPSRSTSDSPTRYAAGWWRNTVNPCNSDGEAYYAFPTPETLAKLKPGDLIPLQFSRQKERYILNLAKAIRSGEIDLDRMAELDDTTFKKN